MEGASLIALSIPVFFALIGVELLVARLLGRKLYRLNDSLNDLSCGVLQQVLGVFTKVVVFGGYVLLYESGHLFDVPADSAAAWVLCFLGVDFFYYWFHRISHEYNLPWGAHIVHHSSEEFNLAVALRQGAFQPLFSWVFYLPLALVGFPPLVFLVCSSINTLYQFWIHTRLIGKLGPFEWVFNTPSHHRVHHGCDPKYLDRNYAGTLIVWDRLFGTFQVEEEEPTYGITKPLKSWNPLWANVHYYADLVRKGREAPSLRDKVRLWFSAPPHKPEWSAGGFGDAPGVTPLTHGAAGKYDARAPSGLAGYAFTQFVLTIGLTVFLLFRAGELSTASRVAVALAIAWSVTNLGVLFESRSWVIPSELARLAVMWSAGVVAVVGQEPPLVAAVAAGGALAAGFFASWLLRYRNGRALVANA